MSASAQGFLLLALRDTQLSSPSLRDTGTLCLECVTIPAYDADRDVWLVLRLNAFEMPLSPTSPMRYTRSSRTYTFETASGPITIQLPQPRSAADEEDIETLEVILSQYGPLQTDSDVEDSKGAALGLDDADLKGRLVLVDEDDGEVVGTLGDQFTITEDKGLREQGMEKDPVVVELPDDDAGRDVFVHAIPYEHQDVIMKGATLLSRGIVFATDALASGMTALSSYYISHSTPSEKPLVFSETTRKNVKRVHHISGQAVKVSAKTTALIHGMIDKAVGYVAGKPVPPPRSRPTTPTPVQGSGSGNGNGKSPAPPPPPPPRLPPRGTSSKGDPPPYQQQQQNQGSYLGPPTPESRTITPPPLPPRPPLKNRLLLSTDMLLTTVENSAQNLVTHGSNALSASLGHKFGKDVGDATLLVGGSVRNVGVVYIDARGVGRRALLRAAGKKYLKAKLGSKEVLLGVDEQGRLDGMDASVGLNVQGGSASEVSPGASGSMGQAYWTR